MNDVIHLALAQREVPRTRLSQLLGVGRATLYRHLHAPAPHEADMVVRDRIQQIAVELPAYG